MASPRRGIATDAYLWRRGLLSCICSQKYNSMTMNENSEQNQYSGITCCTLHEHVCNSRQEIITHDSHINEIFATLCVRVRYVRDVISNKDLREHFFTNTKKVR